MSTAQRTLPGAARSSARRRSAAHAQATHTMRAVQRLTLFSESCRVTPMQRAINKRSTFKFLANRVLHN